MTADGSTLEDVRRTLYAGSRATFVERRKELAATARSSGDRDQAKTIGQMRKPTAAAHLVNLLAQADDSSLHELVVLGANIRDAMERGDDEEMRSLLRGRAAAIAKAMAQARKVARAEGESLSGPVNDQIMQTFRAAMATDDGAAAARSGVLTDALDEPGFGGLAIESAGTSRGPARSQRAKAQPKDDATADQAAEEAAERAAAEARITSAEAEVERAEKALAAAANRRDELEREHDRVAAQLAGIEDALTTAMAEVRAVEVQLSDAAAELDAATASSPRRPRRPRS